MSTQENSNRIELIDTIRGITIISMILFHALWDVVYFGFGINEEVLYSRNAYIWQQSICYTFILLSGFCFSYGKHQIKRGLMALAGGIVITIVTLLVIPDERDVFGVLWLIGSSILFTKFLQEFIFNRLKNKNKGIFGIIGLVISILLFGIFRNVNRGYLGFEGLNICALPENLYNGYFMTFLGFKAPWFYSSDYFSFIPWVFLFEVGYFLNYLFGEAIKSTKLAHINIKIFSFLGRNSLIIYMLHQVILYGVFSLIYSLVNI